MYRFNQEELKVVPRDKGLAKEEIKVLLKDKTLTKNR
jgi:hypothetical protein